MAIIKGQGHTLDTGYAIKHYRKQKGLTQTELAERLGGWTTQKVSLYETNKRSVKPNQLETFANAFGITVSEFLNTAFDYGKSYETEIQAKSIQDTLQNKSQNEAGNQVDTLLRCFYGLNDDGKAEALRHIKMLSEILRFQRKDDE